MSWRSKVSTPEVLARISAAHARVWNELEAKNPVDSLDYQAEHDRLGEILVELWVLQFSEEKVVALATARFESEKGLGANSTNG